MWGRHRNRRVPRELSQIKCNNERTRRVRIVEKTVKTSVL
jgi:hypothetical protein